MDKENQSIIYCIRINKTLHRAIHKKATNKKLKPSILIRELLMDKFTQSGT